MTGLVTRWWWIRHAPVSNPRGRIYGATDVPADTTDEATFADVMRGINSATFFPRRAGAVLDRVRDVALGKVRLTERGIRSGEQRS